MDAVTGYVGNDPAVFVEVSWHVDFPLPAGMMDAEDNPVSFCSVIISFKR